MGSTTAIFGMTLAYGLSVFIRRKYDERRQVLICLAAAVLMVMICNQAGTSYAAFLGSILGGIIASTLLGIKRQNVIE